MKGCCKPGLAYKHQERYYCTEDIGTCPFQYISEKTSEQIYLLNIGERKEKPASECGLMKIIERELAKDTEEYT